MGAFITEHVMHQVAAPYDNINKLIHDFLSEVK
jgi:hypothetical protein